MDSADRLVSYLLAKRGFENIGGQHQEVQTHGVARYFKAEELARLLLLGGRTADWRASRLIEASFSGWTGLNIS
jgi:hypothetical protein